MAKFRYASVTLAVGLLITIVMMALALLVACGGGDEDDVYEPRWQVPQAEGVE